MRSLIIVESYTKTKTIKKYLNDPNVTVTFSCGHICNLPKDNIGINVNDWTVNYVPTNQKLIDNIRKLTKNADIIYLASDPDLEGEAIANHLKTYIEDLIHRKKCYRISFNEITKRAILDAINNPQQIDMDKVYAQETRRIIDRLIGYKISPILWAKFNQNYLSAGRVQMAGLIICINQRNKILSKEITPYWEIEGVFNIRSVAFKAKFLHNNEVAKYNDVDKVKELLNNLNLNIKYYISYNKITKKSSPPPPYTTTTLQQDAYNKFKFNTKTTMKLAQDLYENGLITYMRTDSTHISQEAKQIIMNQIKKQFGEEYVKYRVYKTKIANAQEAHEAIRIVNPVYSSIENAFETYTSKHGKLYEIIWKRTMASLMNDAEYMDIQLEFKSECNKYMFKCSKSFLIYDGFLKIYDNHIEDYEELINIILKSKYCFAKEYVSNGNIDNIPSMFNEVQLIKELENEGIGRPSTYASIVDKLLEKKYVELGQNPQQTYELECFSKTSKIISKFQKVYLGGKHKDLLIPTNLGIDVIQYLYELTPYLCDLKFTSKLEDDLDNIICKNNTKELILNNLYSKILVSLENVPKQMIDNRKPVEYKTGIVKTKYGYCYYNKDDNKYTNIEAYLKWKKISVEDLRENDLCFIKSLPKKVDINGSIRYLNIGKYGLYLKDETGNNLKLEKKLWNSFVN